MYYTLLYFLISPRRWGKSSVVKMAMDELMAENKDVRVCYIDAFNIDDINDFYSVFASSVISSTNSKIEKAFSDARKYIGGKIPGVSISDGLNSLISIDSKHNPLEAIASGESQLSSEAVRNRYNLGNLTTITRNKKVFQTQSFTDGSPRNTISETVMYDAYE